MRKIVSHFFTSLDGVVESPQKWQFPYYSDEIGEVIAAGISESDGLLMGRVLYEEWAAYWPAQVGVGRTARAAGTGDDLGLADFINNTPKYVVSTTLEKAEWNNTRLIKGNVVDEIAELKRQPGKTIQMSGSASLARSVLSHGLLDELRLLVDPIVVGSGRRLFENGGARQPLKLMDSKTFSTGVVYLTYAPEAR
jgi:dihydrofolate reductase